MSIIERRGSERINVNFPVSVESKRGYECRAEVCDISMVGLRINIKNIHLYKLLPNEDREHKIETVTLLAELKLPVQFSNVNIILGIVYIQPTTEASSAIGCRFEDFMGNSAWVLSEYIVRFKHNEEELYLTQDLK